MLNIILFGAPGCGKGTQSELLERRFSLCHISTGSIIREQIAAQTERIKNLIPTRTSQLLNDSDYITFTQLGEEFLTREALDEIILESGSITGDMVDHKIQEAIQNFAQSPSNLPDILDGYADRVSVENSINDTLFILRNLEEILEKYKKEMCICEKCSQWFNHELDGTCFDGEDHFTQQCRCNNLCFPIQTQILDMNELLENLSAGRTGSDSTSLNLCTKFFIFDELTGIFHSQNK